MAESQDLGLELDLIVPRHLFCSPMSKSQAACLDCSPAMAIPDTMTSGDKSHSMAALRLLVIVISAAVLPNETSVGPVGFVARASLWPKGVLVAAFVLGLGLSHWLSHDATDIYVLDGT